MKTGQKVYVTGHTSFAQQNAGWSTVKAVRDQYDRDTGKPFKVVKLDDGHWYDCRTGKCYDSKLWAYYMVIKTKKT